MTEAELARFLSYIAVVRRGRHVCWEWQGKQDRFGYGRFWIDGQWRTAHRISYVHLMARAPEPTPKSRRRIIPDELPDVDHRCVNSRCVRPRHLQAVTIQVNQHLRAERARQYRARYA